MANDCAPGTKRVIVHLGLPKTGSTSIQRYLRKNATALAPHLSILVPRKDTALNRAARSAINYSLAMDVPARNKLLSAIRQLRREIEAAPSDCLISHENLSGAVPGNGHERGLFPAIGRIIALLDQELAPMQLHFVIYTREIAPWKASVHNEVVASDGYDGNLDRFLSETDAIGDWDDLRQRVTAAVGTRATFLTVETDLETNHPGRALLTAAGIPAPVLLGLEPVAGRFNTRLNSRALEFIRLLNSDPLDPGARSQVVKLVRRHASLFSDAPAAKR